MTKNAYRHRSLQLIRAFLFMGLLGELVSSAALAESALPSIPLSYFGMHFHDAENGTSWPKAPIGSWRLWDAYTAWPDLEPEPGKWNFTRLDSYVIRAKLSGVSLLLPLGLSPTWASARPQEKSGYQLGNASEPKNMADWRNYVRTVASRYKGKITEYEIWNEVDVPGFYSGNMNSLVQLTKEAYQILKEADPNNILVSPSIVGGKDEVSPKFAEFFQKGGGQFVDVIGYHFYVPQGRPEAMIPLIKQVQKVMQNYKVNDKPLWNTETGWLIRNTEQEFALGSYDKTWVILEPKQAADYLARAYIIAWTQGLQRYYWYSWDNGVMGFLEPKSKQDKTVVKGYGETVHWLLGAKNLRCETNAATWLCNLTDSDGNTNHIVWSEDDREKTFTVPEEWQVEKTATLDGTERTWPANNSNNVLISGSPLRLISAKK